MRKAKRTKIFKLFTYRTIQTRQNKNPQTEIHTRIHKHKIN